MSSSRRVAASRANGKKSKGPVTAEGKARSAANAPAARHGLASPDRAADSICLGNENRDEFMLLYESLVTEHVPATTTEHLTVHEMAVCRWRLHRAWAMETALLENQMDDMMDEITKKYKATDELTRASLAFRELTEKSPSLPILLRYEARLTRQFDRCLQRLAGLRAQREKVTVPADPNPENEHLTHNDTQLPADTEPASTIQPTPRPAGKPGLAPLESTPEVENLRPALRPDDPETAPGTPAPLPPAA